MDPFFIENCFTCGQKPNQHSNMLQITRTRKCISIVINQSRKFASIPRPLKIKHFQQVTIFQQQKAQSKQIITMKSTHENIQPQALYVQTKRLIINPEKQTQKNNDQLKISKTIVNQSGHHGRSKSNYVNPTFVDRDIELNRRRQKKSSFHNSGAQDIINKLQNSKISDKSFCFENQVIMNSNKHIQDFMETSQFSPSMNIAADENKQYFLAKRDLGSGTPFKNVNWTYNSTKQNSESGLQLKRLLGKGRYCQVYLGQQKSTGIVYTLKEIFKQNTLFPFYYSNISNDIETMSQIHHPNIISYYRYFQNKDKIIIIQQYSPSTLQEQLQSKKTLPLPLVRSYIKDIVNAIVTMHENNKFHGNLSPRQIGCGFNTCKVRPSLTYMIGQQQRRFVDDIHAIAILGYQMAYGINCQIQQENYNQMQCTPSSELIKNKIILDLATKKKSQLRLSHRQLIFFIQELLCLKDQIQLSTNMCLSHPFFAELK